MAKKLEPIWKRTAAAEEGIEDAVNDYQRRLCRESVEYAVEALRQWVARGIEWFKANRGWILLLEPDGVALRSIPGATVHSTKRNFRIRQDEWKHSFMWHVVRAEKGDFSNNVRKESRGYYVLDTETLSELAVPLFDENGHEDGKVIGVYNLEGNSSNSFFPALVQELQKNVAMLTPHLLVLRKWYHKKQHEEPWIWHPEVHGWSASKLADRFCHAVVQGATLKGTLQPTCTLWNADLNSRRCWVLGTCGFDNEFVTQLALDLDNSVTGSIAQRGLGKSICGTPLEIGYRYKAKARRMGITKVSIGSLRNTQKTVCGSLNMYTLHPDTVLPTDHMTKRLCEKASGLLHDFYDLRKSLGVAYVNGQLAKAADPTPHPGIFRRALMKILPCDAASLFVARVVEGETRLVAIDSTGFMNKDRTPIDHNRQAVELPVTWKESETSITATCFTRTEPILVNFPSELTSHAYGLPSPNREYSEVIMYGDADPHNRRRLGIAVRKPGDSQNESQRGATGESPTRPANVGVIRLYRSSANRPFTQADAEFLRTLVTTDRCQRLFENWAAHRVLGGLRLDPDIPIPPSVSVRSELRSVVKLLKELGANVQSATLFVRREEDYQEFVCHPSHELPPEETSFGSNPERNKGFENLLTRPAYRAWIRLLAWSGQHLMRTILAFDCADKDTAQFILGDLQDAETVHPAVHAALLRIASRLTTNLFYPDTDSLTSNRIVEQFCAFVREKISYLDEEPERKNPPGQEQKSRPESRTGGQNLFADADYYDRNFVLDPALPGFRCPDLDLAEYRVKIKGDGSECWIPLRSGIRRAGFLRCQLQSAFAEKLGQAMASTEAFHRIGVTSESVLGEFVETWSQLRRGVGDIVGAWTRIVAPILEDQPS